MVEESFEDVGENLMKSCGPCEGFISLLELTFGVVVLLTWSTGRCSVRVLNGTHRMEALPAHGVICLSRTYGSN
jgi:hypothetical protein